MSEDKLIFEQEIALKDIKQFQENLRKAPHDRRTLAYYKGRLTLLELYFKTFREKHATIISLSFDNEPLRENNYFKADIYSNYEELFLTIKDEITQKLESLTASTTPTVNNIKSIPGCIEVRSMLKLPPIEIPKFQGNYQDWASFRDLFRSLIHDNVCLSKVQKLHYLKTHLGGEAYQLLKHIQITEASYDQAWLSLTKRYENKRSIVNSYLSTLFAQLPLCSESTIGIRKLVDTTTEILHALENLGIKTTSWDPIIVHQTVQRLDSESRRLWEQSLGSQAELSTFKDLVDFLNARHRALEAISGTKSKLQHVTPKPKALQSIRTFHISKDPPCPCCSGTHFLYKCERFKQLPVERRKEIIHSKSLCLNCLVPGHFVNNCQQRSRCHVCNKKHHTLVHTHLISQSSNSMDSKSSSIPRKSENSYPSAMTQPSHANANFNTLVERIQTFFPGSTSSSSHFEDTQLSTTQPSNLHMNAHFGTTLQNRKVMLSTILVRVESPCGPLVLRALLDQGSEGSLITERAAQLLQLPYRPTYVTVRGIGSTLASTVRKEVTLKIFPRTFTNPRIEVNALVMSTLTELVPSFEIPQSVKARFVNIDLADPTCCDPGRIDLLLGADIYSQILLPEIRRYSPNLPIAQRTVFGWILSGPCTVHGKESEKHFHHILTQRCDHSEIEMQLRKFWELENVQTCINMTPEEESCEKFYNATFTRTAEGRYVVQLPFKSVIQGSHPPKFEGTRDRAIKRFKYLERRFTQSKELYQEYNKFMKEYLDLGHMVPVGSCGAEVGEYYLPHHPVIKETSSTTKLRVVFDGSSKSKCGKSLNDTLSIGPALQTDLFEILLRWRQHRIVFAADIEKMYRQILVSDQDSQFQRIVWRFSETESIKDYRLVTVTYGTSCAPYLAIRTLKQIATDHQKEYPAASRIILSNFYVDDVMFGSHDEETALKIQTQLKQLLTLGGFNLRKWSSNREHLLYQIPEHDREIKGSLHIGDKSVKTLGIHWFPVTDELGYSINVPERKQLTTKRSLLSDIARLFDPLGWLSPIIIKAKIMLQQLWLSGVSWDEPLPAELETEWTTFRKDLKFLQSLRIPRWTLCSPTHKEVELHGFADASIKAYAASVYLRMENHDGNVHTMLLAAKSRVAPVKQVSLPRLELCAAALLVRLLAQIQQALEFPNVPVYAWSDSTIVLCWLRRHPSRWKTFVANRVSQIQSHLNANQWHYIPSRDNPADCSSRGILPSQLINNTLWWYGPSWLSQKTDLWPSLPLRDLDTGEEVKTMKPLVTTTCIDGFSLLSRYSSLSKLTRIIAYCVRFKLRCQRKWYPISAKVFSSDEINYALHLLCKISQNQEFSKEIVRLLEGKSVGKKSKILNLDPFIDDVGMLRVGGRLKLSALPIPVKHPIILSHESPLAKLLVRESHIITLHGGINLMLTYLRKRYWILHAKTLVRQELHRCPTCIRHRVTSRTQMMGNLPKDRVSYYRPFLHSGVDYAGPITLKAAKGRGSLTFKGYICLFICLTTKAIHLEVVSDYTAEGFIAAFRRFTSRRGKCAHLYSDCGTTFVGANKTLNKMQQQFVTELPSEIANMLAQDCTIWHFIPPASPHFGGLWEAGIKSTKHHLKRIIGDTLLTFEEFSTLLTQIEAVLNSRPICPLSNAPDDVDVLTPGHFLVGEPLISLPQPSLLDLKVNRLSRWQLLQRIQQHFWKRWSTEYVTRLQQRPKWLSKTPNLQPGDLVIIKDDRLPPAKWFIGRIIATHPGQDGLVRVATLKCKSGIIKRPITKLCLLPTSELADA